MFEEYHRILRSPHSSNSVTFGFRLLTVFTAVSHFWLTLQFLCLAFIVGVQTIPVPHHDALGRGIRIIITYYTVVVTGFSFEPYPRYCPMPRSFTVLSHFNTWVCKAYIFLYMEAWIYLLYALRLFLVRLCCYFQCLDKHLLTIINMAVSHFWLTLTFH